MSNYTLDLLTIQMLCVAPFSCPHNSYNNLVLPNIMQLFLVQVKLQSYSTLPQKGDPMLIIITTISK